MCSCLSETGCDMHHRHRPSAVWHEAYSTLGYVFSILSTNIGFIISNFKERHEK